MKLNDTNTEILRINKSCPSICIRGISNGRRWYMGRPAPCERPTGERHKHSRYVIANNNETES